MTSCVIMCVAVVHECMKLCVYMHVHPCMIVCEHVCVPVRNCVCARICALHDYGYNCVCPGMSVCVLLLCHSVTEKPSKPQKRPRMINVLQWGVGCAGSVRVSVDEGIPNWSMAIP